MRWGEREEAVMHDSQVPQPTAPSIIPPNIDDETMPM